MQLGPIDSNAKISELFHNDSPFIVSRVGLGGETIVAACTMANTPIPSQGINWFFNNAGFYGTSDFNRFSQMYFDGCKNSDLHAYWGFPGFIEVEDFLVPQDRILIDPAALESFRFDDPWTKNLAGKKILVIHPFKATIENQQNLDQSIYLTRCRMDIVRVDPIYRW